ncbi:unnamed protein product [Calicophoron daubneyi]|uniref:p53 DNA-binding domain-containing protein n=1 Tax=Calicophoron daubneyi TaxID=300641 RepID=A0AAV2T4N1_CALDB
MPPKKLTSDDIPVLDSFPGYYGFDLYRPLCGDTYEATETKPSTAFFFFKDEQGWTNLYSKKTPTWWTLSYWCQRQPPEGSFLRLTPVYGTSDKQQEVIQRCFEDFMAMPSSSMSRYSIVVVGNSLADYFYDPITERLCVTLPYERPKEGCDYSQFNGKFMCFNSCLYNGGQGNKKPLFLIITLERLITGTDPSKGQCEVLGRQCIKFRSCACPKRDKENSERRTGDTVSSVIQSFVKRKKDSDRSERQGKRVRPMSRDYSGSAGKFLRHTGNRWFSPSHDQSAHEHHSGSLEDGFERRSTGAYGDQDNGYTMISYNGESYHLLLVPTGLPGGIETLAGVRLGLIRTWLYSPTKSKHSPPDSGSVKTETEIEKNQSEKGIGEDSSYVPNSCSVDRPVADDILHHLVGIEAHLAHTIRELTVASGNCQNMYQYGGDSTDSQPNSTSAVGLSMGSMEESGNQSHEYPSAVGPLSSDSGLSTDQVQHRAASLPQTQSANGLYTGPPAAHRSSLYRGTTNQSSVYDLDYTSRYQSAQNVTQYASHSDLSGNTQLPAGLSLAYPQELIESYAMVQQIPHSQPSTTNSEQIKIELNPAALGKSAAMVTSTVATRSSLSRSENSTNEVHPSCGVSLNHAFSSSAFYPTQYYETRGNSSEQNSILDSFPRGHISSIVNPGGTGSHANLCFYPSLGPNSLSESLLIPEEVLTNYLDREKGYEENDTSSVIVARHVEST